jgi:hypothetical protein
VVLHGGCVGGARSPGGRLVPVVAGVSPQPCVVGGGGATEERRQRPEGVGSGRPEVEDGSRRKKEEPGEVICPCLILNYNNLIGTFFI